MRKRKPVSSRLDLFLKRPDIKTWDEWNMFYRMQPPLEMQWRDLQRTLPITSQQYQDTWEAFARSWSPGGSAPRIPGVTFGDRLMEPDAPLGTSYEPQNELARYNEIYESISNMYPWMTPGQRREATYAAMRRRR